MNWTAIHEALEELAGRVLPVAYYLAGIAVGFAACRLMEFRR